MLVKRKKIIKLFIYLLVVVCFTAGFFAATDQLNLAGNLSAPSAYAQTDMFGVDYAGEIGLPREDPRLVIVRIIRAALGFLAVVALILIIIAGVIWMTAGGDSKKVQKAQKILLNAVIGLIVIFCALAIVQYIFGILNKVAEPPGPIYRCELGDIRNKCWECVETASGGTTWRWNPNLPDCGGGGPDPNPEYDFSIRQIETSTAGSDYKTDVYQCSRVQTIFNHRVSSNSFDSLDKDSPDPHALKILNSVPSVFSGSWQAANNAIIFKHPDPTNLMFSEDDYQLFNPKLLQDSVKRYLKTCNDPLGCELDTDDFLRWDFRVGDKTDEQAPSIVKAYPNHTGEPDRNVDLAPILNVKFSESIDASTVNSANITLQKLDRQGGGPAPGVGPEDLNFRMIRQGFIFSPVNYLEKFAWYRINVSNIEDLCGNVMQPTPPWEFQTNDRVPGIRRVYPARNATRVCPDTVISVTFNTSMWDSEVYMLVTDSNNNTVAEFRMPKYMSGPDYSQPSLDGIIGGILQIMDTSSHRQFRTYTYYPQWPLNLNTRYSVSIDTTKQADIQGNTVGTTWDFTTGSPDDCVCTPYISYIKPDQGLRGECVTLNGHCFGGMSSSQAAHPAQVSFVDSEEPSNVVSLDVQDDQWDTNYDHYRRSYLTTSIPSDFSAGDRLSINIQVDYNDPDYGVGIESNQVSFYVKSNQQATGPCLWSLRPNHACYDRNIIAKGDRFGDDPGEGQRSTDQNHFDFSSGAIRAPDENMYNWEDKQLRLSVPPETVDGDAFVTAQGNPSNPIWFDLSCGQGTLCYEDGPPNCSDGTDRCAPGLDCADDGTGTCRCLGSQLNKPCDGSDELGCQADQEKCDQDRGYYCAENICRCRRGQSPRRPRVVKVWPKCVSACVNVGLGAWFNKHIDPASFNPTNIKLYECGADGRTCSLDQVAGEVDLTIDDYNDTINQVTFGPEAGNLLTVNQWYRMVMRNLVSADDPPLALSNLNFAGNTAYSWLFKTKDDPDLCQPSAAYVRPEDIIVRQPGRTLKYTALAVGSPDDCDPGGQILNSWVYAWAWDSTQTSIATISDDDKNGDSLVDPYQLAQVGEIEGTTEITAGFDDLSGFGILTTDFGIPDCTQGGQCPGSVWDLDEKKCTPIIQPPPDSFSPKSGPIGSCVTIRGCHFGNRQGFGQVNLGDKEVKYPCPGLNHWGDKEIIVRIPQGATSYPFRVMTTHGFEVVSDLAFGVTDTCQDNIPIPESGSVPCLCKLEPNHGGQNTQIDLFGHNFGDLEPLDSFNQVLFTASAGEIAAEQEVTVWSDNIIKSVVPVDVASGDVTVISQRCRSNSLNFNVTLGGINELCDADTSTPDDCDADDGLCAPGLFCDQESDCTCQLVPGPMIVDHFPKRDSQDVCRNTAVSVTFNQVVNTATLNEQTFKLEWPRDDGLNCDGNPFIAKNNFFKRIIELVKKIFHPTKTLAQTPVWCPVPGTIQTIRLAEGSQNCTNPDGCTKANFYPATVLDEYTDYRIFIQGSSQGVKNSRGGYLASSFISTFETGDIICKIDDLIVEIFIGDAVNNRPIGFTSNQDYFTCAASNDCPDDASPFFPGLVPGNQHVYVVTPVDSAGHILSEVSFNVEWTESDPEKIIESITDVDSSLATQWMKYITAANNNGEGKVVIRADDPNPNDENDFGSATTAVYITNNLCENPWPTRDEGFPFVDNCSAANFSTFYCRDAGEEGLADDLPALSTAARPCNPKQEVMREHLWTRSDNADAIGIRILSNPQHFSPSLWYRQNAPNPTGSASQVTVDGYQAIQDGRTTYVNAANLSGNTLYTNIYLISYSEGADSVTENIFNQLLDNWKYNHNIDTWTCDDGSDCFDDSECSIGACQPDKDKVIRDLTRIQDLAQIAQYLEDFVDYCDLDPNFKCSQNSDCQTGRCIHYPHLRAGSYMKGLSTSRWPISWTATLANELGKSLPVDPLNEFGSDGVNCLPENGFKQTPPEEKTCYTKARGFECPEYSRIYIYQTLTTGEPAEQEFYLYANLEYSNRNWYRESSTHFRTSAPDDCYNYLYHSRPQ